MTSAEDSCRARRDRILAAATRLLSHYGARKTTVADIAREAGVGVGSVYLDFPSKEAILGALARDRHDEVLRAMRAAADVGTAWSARLRSALDARTSAFLAGSDGGAHAADLVHCGTAGVSAGWERYRREERDLLAGLLRAGAEAGELVAGDADRLAETLHRAYHLFAPPALWTVPREGVPAQLADLHQVVLLGLVKRPA